MFKILTLQPGVDDDLQAIQNKWEIEEVVNLGSDSIMNHYLLVQYDIQPPSQQTSGSLPQEAAKKPSAKAAK